MKKIILTIILALALIPFVSASEINLDFNPAEGNQHLQTINASVGDYVLADIFVDEYTQMYIYQTSFHYDSSKLDYVTTLISTANNSNLFTNGGFDIVSVWEDYGRLTFGRSANTISGTTEFNKYSGTDGFLGQVVFQVLDSSETNLTFGYEQFEVNGIPKASGKNNYRVQEQMTTPPYWGYEADYNFIFEKEFYVINDKTEIIEQPECTPNWQPTEFGLCVDGEQTRTYEDLNSCGTEEGKPADETQVCGMPQVCVPVWVLETEWSECLNNVQYKSYYDSNSCADLTDKPNDVSQTCEVLTNETTNETEIPDVVITEDSFVHNNLVVGNSKTVNTGLGFRLNFNVDGVKNGTLNATKTEVNPTANQFSEKTSLGKFIQLESDLNFTYTTISIDYLDSELGNIKENTLRMYWYNPINDSWEVLDGYVDTTNNLIVGITTHFSTFGVFGDEEQEQQESQGSGGGSGSSGSSSKKSSSSGDSQSVYDDFSDFEDVKKELGETCSFNVDCESGNCIKNICYEEYVESVSVEEPNNQIPTEFEEEKGFDKRLIYIIGGLIIVVIVMVAVASNQKKKKEEK